jgi:hypothetical protein
MYYIVSKESAGRGVASKRVFEPWSMSISPVNCGFVKRDDGNGVFDFLNRCCTNWELWHCIYHTDLCILVLCTLLQ